MDQQEGLSSTERRIRVVDSMQARAYLHLMDRPNLTVQCNTLVRILFEGKRAVGVEILQSGKPKLSKPMK